jgi:hypothetical protein
LVTEGGGATLGRLGGFVLGTLVVGGVVEGRAGGVAEGRSGNRTDGNCTDGNRIEGARVSGGATCVGVTGVAVPRVGGLVEGVVDVPVRSVLGACGSLTSGGVFRIAARGGVVEAAVGAVCACAKDALKAKPARSAASGAKPGLLPIGSGIQRPQSKPRRL